jgi:uncharacterized membrane protein
MSIEWDKNRSIVTLFFHLIGTIILAGGFFVAYLVLWSSKGAATGKTGEQDASQPLASSATSSATAPHASSSKYPREHPSINNVPWGRGFFIAIQIGIVLQIVSGGVLTAASWDWTSGNNTWMAWFIAKMVVFGVFTFISSALIGRAPCLEFFRARAPLFATINLILGTFLVLSGVVLGHLVW